MEFITKTPQVWMPLKGEFDVAIIGGGVLGTSISYFLSALNRSKRIAVIEQAGSVAFHTSGRNTGKVHAPYLYDPVKKRIHAKGAFEGYRMWEEYCEMKDLPFKRDGVLEVALNQADVRVLEKYLKWGRQNGMDEADIEILDGRDLKEIEPNLRCQAALNVRRDASTDYATLVDALMRDSQKNGTTFLMNSTVTGISKGDRWEITLNDEQTILAGLLINAAGGRAIDVAHDAEVALNLTDVHFRGEYWKAPREYSGLTKSSVYVVPEFPEYPFLDPHWIIRVDGSCEIGPNAVPVFSPYGYDTMENIKEFVPKMLEMLGSGARKAVFNRQFQELAISEVQSSMSKTTMVNRVRRFLPMIDPDRITKKGTAGIRSLVIDENGTFAPDVMCIEGDSSFHILNYNSPGATGALPFSAYVAKTLDDRGLIKNERQDTRCGPWQFSEISGSMQ